MRKKLAVDQFLLGDKSFLSDRVEPAILGQIDFAGLMETLQHLLHGADVLCIRGAHEMIRRHVECGPCVAEGSRMALNEGLFRLARLRSGTCDLLAVLVGPGEEKHIVTGRAHVPRHDVGLHRRIGMAHMRTIVDVVNRRGDQAGYSTGHKGSEKRKGTPRRPFF
jgi:hypothetical protein